MPAEDPAAIERRMYVDMHLGGVDDPALTLAELRYMGGGGVNAFRSATSSSTPPWTGSAGNTITADDTPSIPAEGTSVSYLVTDAVVWPDNLVWSTDPDGGVEPTIADAALVSMFTLDGTTYAVLGSTFPAPPTTTTTTTTAATTTTTTTAVATILAADTFDRADAGALGTSSSGHAWAAWQPIAISGNRASMPGGLVYDVVTTTSADVEVSADITLDSNEQGLIVRANSVGVWMYLWVTTGEVALKENGASTLSTFVRSKPEGATVHIVYRAVGDSYKVWEDGVLVIDITHASVHSAYVKHGIVGSSGSYVDNFQVAQA